MFSEIFPLEYTEGESLSIFTCKTVLMKKQEEIISYMEIQNCIWTKQCAADSLSGHWKVWKDSKSKSSDPPWSAKQGFLQLWQKVVDKCKLSSLSHYCHHFDWYPLSKVWPLFVVGWWFHKDDNDDYDDDIVGAKGSTQRDELPRDDDVTGLVGKYHQRPPSYSITKMITVLAKMCCGLMMRVETVPFSFIWSSNHF